MNLEEELGKLTQMLKEICAHAESAMRDGDPEASRRMGDALAQMRQHEGPFFEGLRSMHAEGVEKLAQAQQGAEASQKELERLQREYEKAMAARAQPAAPPPKPKPDPGKADQVNAELIRRFGVRGTASVPSAEVPADPGSLWRQMDEEIKPEPKPQPAPPLPAQAGPPPKKNSAPPRESQDASLWPFLDQVEPPDEKE